MELVEAGFFSLVIFGGMLYMSLDAADHVLLTCRRIGGLGVLAGLALICAGMAVS